jgi:hypothetical protein
MLMLDTLTANFAPQFRHDPRTYMAQLLERMAPYRHVPGRLQIRVAPDDSNAVVAASAAFEGRLSVPSRSRLWAISGSSNEAAGFDLQLRDGETMATLFGRRAFFANATGQASATDPQSRLFFLPKPMLFMADQGVSEVLVQCWNRASAQNSIQVLLWFISPEA